MRTLITGSLLVLLLALVALTPAQEPAPTKQETAPAKPAPPDPAIERLRTKLNPEYEPWSPAYVYERCAEHLATVNQYDRPRVRYFDLSGTPRAMLSSGSAALFFGSNSAARVTQTEVPRAVPNTDNRIFWIDLNWFNWTPETWEAISEEDPYFREPIIPSDSLALAFLKKETYANPVIRGDWFLYYAYDNSQFLKLEEDFNDKAFYYRLVYSSVAFERDVKEKKEIVETVTDYEVKKIPIQGQYGQTAYQEQRVPVKKKKTRFEEKVTHKKVNGVGPKNMKEFFQAWKVDFNVLKDFPIDQGALIEVSHSGVSYENRIVWRVRTAIGTYWRTFDVLRAVGDQDFVETPFPKKFDAGEHIVQDNRGCQFYHLSNGKDESIDYADPRVVNNKAPSRVLMTAGACIHCHDNGIIGFENHHRRLADIGVQLKAIDFNRAERYKQFYLQDRKMKKFVGQDQDEYQEFIKDCNGLSPQENTVQFNKYRGWYAKPVTLAQAAREVGCPEEELADAIGYQGTKGRLGGLVLDNVPIPRQTWERGLYQEAALLLLKWREGGRIPRGGEGRRSTRKG